MEAQSQGLCCLSKRLSGIEELIDRSRTGFLVDPGSSDALRDALPDPIGDPERRRYYGANGKDRVRDEFDAAVAVRTLYDRFVGCNMPAAKGRL